MSIWQPSFYKKTVQMKIVCPTFRLYTSFKNGLGTGTKHYITSGTNPPIHSQSSQPARFSTYKTKLKNKQYHFKAPQVESHGVWESIAVIHYAIVIKKSCKTHYFTLTFLMKGKSYNRYVKVTTDTWKLSQLCESYPDCK